ncbi:MAG: PEGA domain-containing protein [Phycisphaerales bacterium]|nr:PEGA domain-containing protein [Phycisphaerales bacterium]
MSFPTEFEQPGNIAYSVMFYFDAWNVKPEGYEARHEGSVLVQFGLGYSYGTPWDDEWGVELPRMPRLGVLWSPKRLNRVGRPSWSYGLPGAWTQACDQTTEGLVKVLNPLFCEKCGQELPSDDAIAVIEGVCTECRQITTPMAESFHADEIIPSHEALEPSPPLRETVAPAPPRSSTAIPAPADALSDLVELHRMADREVMEAAPPPKREEPRLYPPQFPSPSEQAVVAPNRSQMRKRRWRRGVAGGISVGLLLSVAFSGYYLVEEKGRQTGSVRKTLDSASFILTVSPSSAIVKLDGIPVEPPDVWGKVNLPLSSGGLDDRILEISAEGYRVVRQPLSTYKGAPEAFIELLRKPYQLDIATVPLGAEIFINDELKGRSPLKLVVGDTDGARLKVCRKGFHTLSQNLQPPESGDQLRLNLELAPVGPMVAVETDPSRALISINGETKGSSPLEVELDGADLGREAEIVASAPGYDNAVLRVSLPEIGGGEPVCARIVLAPQMARIEVDTEPAGGRVIIAGEDYGEAPTVVAFEGAETGKTVVVEAVRSDSYTGRQVQIIPPVGETVQLTVPMAFGAQRVVFLLAIPPDVGAAHFALAEHLASRIHQLKTSQRFAILTATNGGIETWPSGRKMETGSIEQKIRAYDVVRAVRPTERIDLDQLLQASLAYDPTTIWMFVEGESDWAALEQFERLKEDQTVSVHIVRATVEPQEETQLQQWAARYHGTFTLLGHQPPRSTVALDSDADY